MKKQYLFLILIYSVVVLVGVTLVVMASFNLNFHWFLVIYLRSSIFFLTCFLWF